MKFPTIEEMARNVAEKALDEYEYNGKTLREWVEIISSIPVTAIPATDNNVGTKVGTNLTEVGTDCISRQQAIDIAKDLTITVEGYEIHNQAVMNYCADIMQLPPIKPKRGRWIDGYCSECGTHAPFWAMASTYHKSNFCPNCGADMEATT